MAGEACEPPWTVGGAAFGAEVYGLKGGPAEEKIEERGVVRLYDEEEDLFKRDIAKLWANDDVTGVAPDAGADKIRVPWYGRGNSDLARQHTAAWSAVKVKVHTKIR